jgi:ABC-2 type transport system ATP-binding protein
MSMAAGQPALRVAGLRKRFGDVVAVDGLDLTVAAGECFGLLGPNGAGKTTTIEICEGLTPPDEGVVEVLGQRWDRDERALRERLGIQLQETKLAEKLTVEETVRLFRSFYARGRDVGDVIGVVQLEEKRGARVGKLSGGQKQRLALACALVGDPELLFLDEPTTGLDPQSRRQLWDLITELKASGRSIVLTTHYMDEAERLCDRVAIVDHGRVIALGTPRELIAGLGAEHVVEFSVTGGADGALDAAALERLGTALAKSNYGRYLLGLLSDPVLG